MRKPKVITYGHKVREANRQYEFNFNGEVDNGIMISHANEQLDESASIQHTNADQQSQKPHEKLKQNGSLFNLRKEGGSGAP